MFTKLTSVCGRRVVSRAIALNKRPSNSFVAAAAIRPFSWTAPIRAQESPEQPSGLDALTSRPTAMEALENMATIIEETTGTKVREGEVPTTEDLTKLAQDERFRKAAETVRKEMQEAGINVDQLSQMAQNGFSGFKPGDGENKN